MLKDNLEIHMAIYRCNMFMQDGAPCHRSKLVSDFFKKNINKLDWSGNSPDLNPIEKIINKHSTNTEDLEMAKK